MGIRKPYINVQRRDFGNTHGKIRPRGIVLHSTESHDREGNSDLTGVLTFLERTPDRLGIHFVVDKEGRVGQGAYSNDLVYHCRGVNSDHIGIEMIGFARFSAKIWYARYRQRRKVAKLLAYLSKKYDIPLRSSVTHGVCMHRQVPGNDHWDPGYGYPFRATLRLARKYRDS